MKRKDIILIAVFLCVALAGLIAVRLIQSTGGALVKVTVDGKLYGTYDLYTDRTVEIKDELGYNKIVIKDGYADVTDADCPDRICVDHARIHNDHESIICLPHKLVVEISGGSDSGIDAKTQ